MRREGKKGEREREVSECFVVDEVILKILFYLGFVINLNSVKGNYYYFYFRNDEREVDILCG